MRFSDNAIDPAVGLATTSPVVSTQLFGAHEVSRIPAASRMRGHSLYGRDGWPLGPRFSRWGTSGMVPRDLAMTKRNSTWAAVIVTGLAISSPDRAQGGERYYSMIFGSQSSPKRLQYTHTWATFIRVVGEGD